MEKQLTTITVETIVNAPVQKAWECWTNPEHVKQWNNASDDWHTTSASNDLRVGGQFSYHMAAKDGSFGFDFGGTYDAVKTNELIEYTLGDNRKVKVTFTSVNGGTKVVETFEAEETHTIEQQQTGWQNIMDNYKKHTETKA